MVTTLALNWWTLALRGTVAILIAIGAFLIPAVTVLALTLLFGVYALLDGVVSITAAIRSARRGDPWWALLFEGIMGILAAVITVIWPGVTLVFLVYLIAGWAVLTGILEIVAAVRLRRYITGEWLLGLAGVASVLFGIMLFAAPGLGALVLAWWIGAYVLIFGILMLAVAFRLRRWSGSLTPQHT